MANLNLKHDKELLIGIDFGTTNCAVSLHLEGEPVIIPIDGANTFPTAIMFEPDSEEEGKLLFSFGSTAKEAATIYPESTVLSIKRYLTGNKKIKIYVDDNEYDFSPWEIAGEVLAYIKEQAQDYLLEELSLNAAIKGAVITVPANSTDKQKQMTKRAAILAGFDEDKIFLRPEPAAAAITYALEENNDKNILVYDFGGGTFDACILKVEAGEKEPQISILSTYGENELGGDDIDKIVMDIIYEEFKKQTDNEIDLFDTEEEPAFRRRQKKMAVARLEQISRRAKERLSVAKSTKITLAPFIQEPRIVNINMEISRETFLTHRRQNPLGDSAEHFEKFQNKNLEDLIDITIKCVDNCIKTAGIEEINEIFLVGGSSSIVRIEEVIKEKLKKEIFKSKISPALSISLGAATYANLLLSPVATGPRVKEVTLHPLGLEVAGRRFEEIVKSGQEIPKEGLTVEAKEPFATNFDNLTSMAIVVYEDTAPDEDKSTARDGMKRLAATSLRGIPPGPKGQEKVKIIFTVSQDNMLKVRALSTGDLGLETELLVDELY